MRFLAHCADSKEWWRRQESNLRHLECKSSALPTELRPHADWNNAISRYKSGGEISRKTDLVKHYLCAYFIPKKTVLLP